MAGYQQLRSEALFRRQSDHSRFLLRTRGACLVATTIIVLRKFFESGLTKTAAAVAQPNVQPAMGQGLLDDQISHAIMIDVQSYHRKSAVRRFETQLSIAAVREMNLEPVAHANVICTRRKRKKKGAIGMTVAIEVRSSQPSFENAYVTGSEGLNNDVLRQRTLQPILRTQSRYRTAKRGKHEEGDDKTSQVHRK